MITVSSNWGYLFVTDGYYVRYAIYVKDNNSLICLHGSSNLLSFVSESQLKAIDDFCYLCIAHILL